MMKIFARFNKTLLFLSLSLPFLLLAACKGEPKFKVSGEVDGGADKSLVLEKSDFHGRWIPLDSVKISSSGKFSMESAAPASPDIYRLSLGDRFIYFPVDSVENITVTSPAARFGVEFDIDGSDQARAMASFEKELMALDFNDAAKRDAFKRNVYTKYLKDSQGSIIGYYVLTKIVNGKPLYDPESKEDAKYYAAVATAFEQYHPDDPHAGMLRQVSLEALKRRNAQMGRRLVMEANEITLLDIDLQDETGRNVKLSDVAGKGKPTVVVFSMMTAEDSPALNMALSEIYNAHSGNVAFYHVSLDADQYTWREAARNLPWTTVIDPAGQTSDALRDYNVSAVPVFYIYNAAGSLADRADNVADLRKKLSSY